MEWLIIVGAVISALGLVGLIASAVKLMRARRARLEDDAMRNAMRKALTLNFAALMLSVFGLMMVVIGVILA
jgi:hypothetical protein